MKFSNFAKRARQQHVDARASTQIQARGNKQAAGFAAVALLFGASLAAVLATAAHAEAPSEADTPEAAMAGPAPAIASLFTIVNYGSGLCLEPVGSGWGEPIVQQPCSNARAQRWSLSPATRTGTTTRYLFVNRETGLCMDVRDGVDANGTIVQQWSCDMRNRSMRWALTTLIPDLYFKVVSEIGSRCLDVAGGSLQPGAQIQIYRCTPGVTNTAQIFALQSSGAM
jgi:hypothetical protein